MVFAAAMASFLFSPFQDQHRPVVEERLVAAQARAEFQHLMAEIGQVAILQRENFLLEVIEAGAGAIFPQVFVNAVGDEDEKVFRLDVETKRSETPSGKPSAWISRRALSPLRRIRIGQCPASA